jgi:hypothetical protein
VPRCPSSADADTAVLLPPEAPIVGNPDPLTPHRDATSIVTRPPTRSEVVAARPRRVRCRCSVVSFGTRGQRHVPDASSVPRRAMWVLGASTIGWRSSFWGRPGNTPGLALAFGVGAPPRAVGGRGVSGRWSPCVGFGRCDRRPGGSTTTGGEHRCRRRAEVPADGEGRRPDSPVVGEGAGPRGPRHRVTGSLVRVRWSSGRR